MDAKTFKGGLIVREVHISEFDKDSLKVCENYIQHGSKIVVYSR